MAKTTHAWQIAAIAEATGLLRQGKTEIATQAGVGSGKTYFAARLTESEIASVSEPIEQIIIVTINRRCQRQWWRQMKELGIPLLRLNGNSNLHKGLPPDVMGYITTYQGMSTLPDLHAAFCGRARTLVIFDEIHHLNEDPDTSWGKAAITAFESAKIKLTLSGTYFSSNDAKIPFTRMKPMEGSNTKFVSDPHINYTYGESVADEICRRLIFKPFDGPLYYRRDGDDNFRTSTFADVIDDKDLGLRLWAAGQPIGAHGQPNNLLNEMLFRANRQLMDLRIAGHQRAAGLIACDDKAHARKIRALIEKISGHRAVLVLSDEPGSDKAIDSFANGFAPWMVAVRMVTEGVDIPRLRVGVYLANVVKDLTFIQFLGRQVRHFKGDDQKKGDPAGKSYIFYPADARLVETATEIETEIQKYIDLKQKKKKEPGLGPDEPRRRYEFGGAEGEEQDNIVAGETYTVTEIELAEQLRKRWPNLAEAQIIDMIKFVRASRGEDAPKQRTTQPPPTNEDDEEDHESLRQATQKLVQRIGLTKNREFNDVHVAANKAVGIINIDNATVDQLKAKRAWLNEHLTVSIDPEQWAKVFNDN